MLVWWNATVADSNSFYESITHMVPEGTMIFGTQEIRGGGRFNYRVVIALPMLTKWEHMEQKFAMKSVVAVGTSTVNNTFEYFEVEAVSVVVPTEHTLQNVAKFLRCAQEYCKSYSAPEDGSLGRAICVDSRSLSSEEVSCTLFVYQ
jgi:hypothetical protein